jgi:hypothetical protein
MVSADTVVLAPKQRMALDDVCHATAVIHTNAQPWLGLGNVQQEQCS